MRLADDRRGRVPFALLGVLLLVGSATYATTLADRGPIREDHAVETAMDRATAGARTALASAARAAARDAAATPVTRPANTTVGRALDDERPFRDALRLRVYVAARERLRTARYRRGDVTAGATLPTTSNASALRAAIERVDLQTVRNGTGLRVTVRDLAVVARRGGREVARASHDVTVVVPSPVLALHDRTVAFERRLNRGPLAGPGLGRGLTARLYPMAWARGYAQYGGAPVGNVVGTRHVELAANGGVLAAQRAAFGRSDPDGRLAHRRAALRTGTQDLLAPIAPAGASVARARTLLPAPGAPRSDPVPGTPSPTAPSGPGPDRTLTVGVNHTADRALAAMASRSGGGRLGGPNVDPLDGTSIDSVGGATVGTPGDAGRTRLAGVLRGSYRAELRVLTAVRTVRTGRRPGPNPPGPGWRLAGERTSRRTVVSTGTGPTPTVPVGVHALVRYTRRVEVRHTVRRTWRKDGNTTGTRGRWVDRYRVGVTVAGRYSPRGDAPSRAVRRVFERGGALDGPNLADVAADAEAELGSRGGRDAVAARAATDGIENDTAVVHGDRPAGLERWVYADLDALRERVRNVSLRVPAVAVATGRTNPPARLAATLRARRDDLVDAPARYDGVADRARVAARTAYLDRVLAELEHRAARTRRANDDLGGTLAEAGVGSPDRVAAVADARRGATRPARQDPQGLESRSMSGPGRNVTFHPDGSPAYLTATAVDGARLPGVPDGRRYHPLATRNLNLFTVPYGDAADTVIDGVFGSPDTVSPRTAARALLAANRTLAARDDRVLRARRDALRRDLSASVRVVRREVRLVLAEETDLSAADRRGTVAAAVSRWNGTARRALAASNGSLARAVVREVGRRSDLRRAARTRLALRVGVATVGGVRSPRAQVPEPTTNRSVVRTRELVRTALKGAIETAADNATRAAKERWLGDALGEVPAGLPVAPVPGYWYTTVNVWSVTVRGEYGRFAVRARGHNGTAHAYVRDGSVARLDVDGDGRRERLGRGERVRFETGTTVVVAVPPNGNGVGDVNGDADERSPGWPRPGCVPRRAC